MWESLKNFGKWNGWGGISTRHGVKGFEGYWLIHLELKKKKKTFSIPNILGWLSVAQEFFAVIACTGALEKKYNITLTQSYTKIEGLWEPLYINPGLWLFKGVHL